MSQAKPKPVFEQVSDEIKSGGFSILSQKAQDSLVVSNCAASNPVQEITLETYRRTHG